MVMRDLKSVIDACTERESRVKQLERENEFLLRAIVEVERAIDHGGDLQQISCGIKQLRGMIGTPKIMDSGIKPGLVKT
jgi:hypothetical protein